VARAGNSPNQTSKWVRWIARAWSVVVIGVTAFMIIAHAVIPEPGEADYPPIENLLPVLMCVSVAGLGVAWRWEGLGGAINVVFFLANLGLYWAIRGYFMPLRAVAVLSLALAPGILFLLCWWRTRPKQALKDA